MQIIPLQPIASQVIQATLNNQACTIRIYQKFFGLFCDLLVNDVLIIGGVICLNGVRIVQSLYLGFSGDLAFIDTQGTNDPTYSGLGDRYFLTYLSASELPAGLG